jgi:DNA-binding NarL/FixJ family response regulator
VARYEQLEPDVVVMDVHMPGLGGVEATRQILCARPQTAVVMLTMMDEDDSMSAAMRAGARG